MSVNRNLLLAKLNFNSLSLSVTETVEYYVLNIRG